ncbi:hypothetical protein [Streptomyces sp. NPDC012510]|uniref:hypothetical protein n=1 Tax=Streptomyces sp. NPDC012510 TaxID=3364838 RepID=UPI0036EF96DF
MHRKPWAFWQDELHRSDMMGPRRDIAAAVRDQASPALTAGIDPSSPLADPIVAAFTAQYARLLGRPDDVELRRQLATRLESVNDRNDGVAARRHGPDAAGAGRKRRRI